jgi:hypothetical protein
MTDKCFACDRPLKGKHLVDTRDDQTVFVGPDCFKRVKAAGDAGWQPPMQYRRPFRPDTPLPHPSVPRWATWLATVGMLAALVFAVTAVV